MAPGYMYLVTLNRTLQPVSPTVVMPQAVAPGLSFFIDFYSDNESCATTNNGMYFYDVGTQDLSSLYQINKLSAAIFYDGIVLSTTHMILFCGNSSGPLYCTYIDFPNYHFVQLWSNPYFELGMVIIAIVVGEIILYYVYKSYRKKRGTTTNSGQQPVEKMPAETSPESGQPPDEEVHEDGSITEEDGEPDIEAENVD
jgi:hypothetical protein